MCHLYLTPEAVYLMHNVLTSDGIQAIAQFPKVPPALLGPLFLPQRSL